jgi:hypothetical protein
MAKNLPVDGAGRHGNTTFICPPIVAYDRSYLRKLGISEDLEDLTVSTPASEVRILTKTELLKLRLATEVKDGRAVVYPSE